MQFDDKDLNNNLDDSSKETESTAISWEDLLSADDDADFSSIIKIDEGADNAPKNNGDPSILDYDIKSYDNDSLGEKNPQTEPPETVVKKYDDVVDEELLSLLDMDKSEKEIEYAQKPEPQVKKVQNNVNVDILPEDNQASNKAQSKNVEYEAPMDDFVPYDTGKKKKSPALLIIFLLLLIIVGGAGFVIYQYFPEYLPNQKANIAAENVDVNKSQKQDNDEGIDIEAIKAKSDALVENTTKADMQKQLIEEKKKQEEEKKLEEEKKKQEEAEKKVVVQVANTGRKNPFMSPSIFSGSTSFNSALSLPPDPLVPDPAAEEARELMSITVSGIMYDPEKPSAIIRVGQSDYFVQAGDRVANFEVLSVAQNHVVLQTGANVYKVSLGERVSIEDVERSIEQDSIVVTNKGRQYH